MLPVARKGRRIRDGRQRKRACERSDFSLTAEDRSAAEAPVSPVSQMIDHSVSSLSAPEKSSFQTNEKTNLDRVSPHSRAETSAPLSPVRPPTDQPSDRTVIFDATET